MDQMPRTPLAGRSDFSSGSSTCTSVDDTRGRRPLTPPALREWLLARELPSYRSTQILRWVYQRGARAFSEMTDVGRELRAALARGFEIPSLDPVRIACSVDGTQKLLFALEAGRVVETVAIPDPPRLTVCLSSQVGCAMECGFCATARMGLQRNLSAVEIVGQLLAARKRLGCEAAVTNVVFMGMGEPLANYDAVVEAIGILVADWGLGFSSRRITVSTVGIVPQMQRLVRDTAVNIAVSLTATSDETRDRLMPINRRYPLSQLMAACRALPIAQRRRITFEYVLLAGTNDTPADAARLVRLLHGIRAKVNLIPFNPFSGSGFNAPSHAVVWQFQERLLRAGLNASVRAHRGRDIRAACGQLAAGSPARR